MKKILYVLALMMAGVVTYGQTARVVGYLPTYRFTLSGQIDYCKLTHLNLAFANPDSLGNILMPDIGTVVSDALYKNPSIIICISLGGGALSAQQKADWSRLIDIPGNRPELISSIIEYVLENKLHGVDMDLEWDAVSPGYSDFIIELDSALFSQNKILTVAFPNQTWFSNVSHDALDAFDFINIMSYDATGPWKPLSPGQHSSLEFSRAGINFWQNTAGIKAENLTLGVPFYGYDFVSSTLVNAVSFGSIVAQNPDNADLDELGNLYYNGRPTIEAKVALANDEASGIMIWELGQDSFDEYSLLQAIHQKYTSLGIRTTGLCGNETASSYSESVFHREYIIYPNPASGFFTIEGEGMDSSKVRISNALGQSLNVKSSVPAKNKLYFDISSLQPGIYYILILSDAKVLSPQKLIVM